MTHEFCLLHRKGSDRFSAIEESGVFSFATCMRHILVVDPEMLASFDDLRADDQVLRGEDAYRFLLQVVCGLQSPLIGETEVYGQFKNAVATFTLPSTPWGGFLARLFRQLFEDVKKIRQQYLEDLGSQSYGSLLRRELRGTKSVHIIGAGHLVQEVLPWIAKNETKIVVHCRNVEKARRELGALAEKVQLSALDPQAAVENVQALIVAAPVSAAWISEWLRVSKETAFIADLRAQSAEDRVVGFARVLDLSQITAGLTTNQALLQERKLAALEAVEAAVQSRSRTIEYRPFGWDDVCA